MKKIYVIVLIAASMMITVPASLKAQLSQGGTPLSFDVSYLKSEVETLKFKSPEMEMVRMEDIENDGKGIAYRIGVIMPVNLNPDNSGTWEILPDGDFLWRLQIDFDGPEATNLLFDQFNLPPGAKLYVYNPEKTFMIGAFTEVNNHESGLMATQLIPGGSQVVELFLPAEHRNNYTLDITEVVYAYRSTGFEQTDKDLSCMVNVKCPTANTWQDQVSGVAKANIRIGMNWFMCSGSLVAQTNNSCAPYFLLSDHCAYYSSYASAANMNQWVFNFNFQAASCTGTTGSTAQSLTGCTLKAHDTWGSNQQGSDFYLVLLNNTIPNSYQHYYNGWSRSNTAATSGAGIHHPEGVIKKFSIYSTTLATAYTRFWRVIWANQPSYGHSVTAQGSSGSPIFNQSKLLVGTLSFGSSYCNATSDPDYYGKFNYHWDQNGTTAAKQLKPWLDPTNTNAQTKTGYSYSACLPNVSVEELSAPNLNISLYPNPAQHIINFSFENYLFDNGIVRVYDILGNMVAQLSVDTYMNEISLPVGHLANGIYYLQAQNDHHQFSGSFMISR
jgi:hypothetical protein